MSKRAVDFDGFFDGEKILADKKGNFYKVIAGFVYGYELVTNSWEVLPNVKLNQLMKFDFSESYDPTTKTLSFDDVVNELMNGNPVRNSQGTHIRFRLGKIEGWDESAGKWQMMNADLAYFIQSNWFRTRDPETLEQ
jgi:hypothetical protein